MRWASSNSPSLYGVRRAFASVGTSITLGAGVATTACVCSMRLLGLVLPAGRDRMEALPIWVDAIAC